MKAMINIPRGLTHGDDLVVIRKADYDALQQQIEEFKDALGKIQRGEREFKNGKTKRSCITTSGRTRFTDE